MKKFYFLIPILLLFYGSAWAQPIMKLHIDSPASVAGIYTTEHAAFGYDCTQSISGEIAFIDDGTSSPTEGCSPAQNDLTGKIAFIDRGSCNFSLKAWNAQEAGAVAVVICNNNLDGTFVMTPGLHGDEVTVHTVMMSKKDCNTIRAEVPGATAVLKMDDVEPERTTVLWEEDFDNGMEGWKTTTQTEEDDVFFWSDNGFTTFRGINVKLGLTSSYCTGAVGFPSGWYQTGRTGLDSLTAPGPPYPNYDAELISPLIDLSGVTKPVSLKFDQNIRRLNANSGSNVTFIAYSINGGETFSDAIAVNTELENFDRVHNTVKLNIPDIQGESEVKIKFIYAMDYYYWIIDNVRIVEREENNLGITPFFAISPYTHIPKSQVGAIYFAADFLNSGAKTQENVKLNIEIEKDGQQLHSETLDFGTIELDSVVENQVFTNSFAPSSKGVYTGTYTVSADAEDFDPKDNIRSFNFEVTDSIYAKEAGRTRQLRPAARAWSNGKHSWAIGNVFHIKNDTDDAGKKLICKSLTIGVSNPSVLKGQLLLAFLYQWNDDNKDGNADPGELIEVGGTSYEFTGDEENGINLEMILDDTEEDGDEEVNLVAGHDYIAMAQYTDETADVTADDIFLEASEAHNYRAQIFVNTPEDVQIELFSGGIINYGFGIGEPRYGTVVGILDDPEGSFGDIVYETNYFNMDITPVIRMKIIPSLLSSSKDVLSENNRIELYPNPTSNLLNVKVDLEEEMKQTSIQIVDVTGKVLFKKKFSNLKQGDFTFETNHLANGIYQLNFITEKGSRTKKFVVMH